MIFKLNLSVLTFALLGIVKNNNVTGAGLRGTPTTEMDDAPYFNSYDDYIESMIIDEDFQENSTSPLLSVEQLGSFPSYTQAKFPKGIFDKSKLDDPMYLNKVMGSCSEAITQNQDSSPGEKLACHLLYLPSWEGQPMALGTLKLDVNLFDSMTDGSYKKSDINNIFKDYALAIMIDEGCLSFDAALDKSDSSSVKFVDESSYEKSLEQSNSIQVDTSATGWGVTVKAGYKKMSSSKNTETENRKYAFGENKWYASVGTLRNSCLVDEGMFKKVIFGNKLVRDEWIEKWTDFNSAPCKSFLDFLNDINSECHKAAEVALEILEDGLLIPTSYNYGASVYYSISSTYEEKNIETSKSMSDAINAGLSAEFQGIGGSVDAAVEKAVTESLSKKEINEEIYVKSEGYGNKVDISCIQSESCSTNLLEAVEEMRGDFNNVGKPLGHSSFVSLDDIAFWYTGKRLSPFFWLVADWFPLLSK